ncbi:ATP-binding protein [Streptomyces sp. ACA25]|uniref:ATP-binding protein n=1 Tax=Streptomyces sp. ACA25 TaxID=3022596 RepID=UPI00230827F6|nr:ATP-binding protein [Streptomyces sp. ACA25]MDB1087693.1 ATP-binding protein [Streptomyces sp. ACA25]
MTVTKQGVDHIGGVWALKVTVQDLAHWRGEAGTAVAALGGDRGAVEVVRLGVSELLSNVCRHVEDRRCRLEVRRVDDAVLAQVFDRSLKVPAVLVPDAEEESGRGLWLLREMTRALGYVCTPDGKWVWFTVPLVTVNQEGS